MWTGAQVDTHGDFIAMAAEQQSGQMQEFLSTAKVLQAETLKDAGNESYKKGHYTDAITKYTKALHKLQTGAATESSRCIQLACLTNRAACALKLDIPDTEACAEDCTAALDLDPDNAKALFRRGIAFSQMGLSEAALPDLQAARKLKPSDPKIQKALAMLMAKDENKEGQ